MQSTGPISFSDFRMEFAGTIPILGVDYYAHAIYVRTRWVRQSPPGMAAIPGLTQLVKIMLRKCTTPPPGMSTTGVISIGQMGEEFSLLSPLYMSQLYLGTGSNAVVQPEGGSNAGVPSSGTIRISNMRGAVSTKTINTVSLTFQADFASLQSNPALMTSFQTDVRTTVAAAAGVPLSSITIIAVTSGSVKVAIDVRYPKAGKVNRDVLPKLAAIASATSAATFFGADFISKYAMAAAMVVADVTPPQLLTSFKSLTGVAGSAASVSVSDMFAAASGAGGGALTYAIASTTNPTPANVSVDASTGLVMVNGRYLNRTYAVNAVATGANGVPSSPVTLSVTEIDAPLPTLTMALGSASLSNDTRTIGLSNHFTTAADTLPLYYWHRSNPNSNASIGTGGVMSVVGANRGTTYNVSVGASNAYGKSNATAATLSVTEAAAAVVGRTPVFGYDIRNIACYPGSGSTIYDTYGGSVNMTMFSGAKYNASPPHIALPTTAAYCASTLGKSVNIATNAGFSVEYLFRSDAANSSGNCYVVRWANTQYQLQNGVNVTYYNNSGYGFANAPFTNYVWQHVFFVLRGTTGYFYINNTLKATVTGAAAATYTPNNGAWSGPTGIGFGGNNSSVCSVAVFNVYDRPLLVSDISERYTAIKGNGNPYSLP
jgi:hypothetical protein